MGILDKFSLDNIFAASPDLYGFANNIEPEIRAAIDKEVSKYNFTDVKAEYVRAKVEGSIIGSLMYDTSFKLALDSAPTTSARQEIIRGYIRNYISREINIEITNVQREIRQNIQTSIGTPFSILDPRWKKKAKGGDYSQYEEYRKNVKNYLIPTIGGGGEGDTNVINQNYGESEQYKYLKQQVDDFNNGKLTLPAGTTPQAYFDRIALDSFNASRIQNYVHETGNLVSSEDLGILAKIDQKSSSNSGIKRNLSQENRIGLLEDLKNGDVDSASKNYTKRFELFGKVGAAAPKEVVGELLFSGKTSGDTASEFSQKLLVNPPHIEIGADGKAVLKGEDVFKAIYDQSLEQYKKGLQKNPKKALQEFQHQNIAANVSSLKMLLHQATGPVREIQAALEKNELVHDILNFAKATKSFTSFSTKNTAEATRLKNRILAAVSAGTIKFKNDAEKANFINAVNTNDSRFLNKFITPGMFGTSTFSNLLNEVHEMNLEIGGQTGSTELITRALNFENNRSLYKQEVLNNIIYAAQLGYDSGYFFSEIKKRLKESEIGQIWSKLDTEVSWKSVKEKSKENFIKFLSNSAIFGKYAANSGDLENLFKLYNNEVSFGNLLGKRFRGGFESFLKNRFGVVMNLDFKWTLKEIMKSRLYTLAKLKLLKNLRFLEKLAGLGFKKLAGPLGGFLSKAIAGSWSSIARGAGRFLGTFGNILNSILGKFGPSSAAMARFVRALAISILLVLLVFVLVILPPVQAILGAFNSLSSNRYDPEATLDQNYGAARPLSGQGNVIASGSFTSGNVCVAPDGRAVNTSEYPDWNNLNLSDFENTKNDVNCRIMCNAKNTMGAMFIGTGNSINCNAIKSLGPLSNINNQFVCTDLIISSYRDDDPGIVSRLVIEQDRYLESKPNLYEQIELAVPNDPADTENLDVYYPRCVPLEKFAPGNIFVMRANTCNDTYVGGYLTVRPNIGLTVTSGAHVEMVLKVVDEGGKKVLWNLSTNHIRKKIKYDLIKCDGNNYRLSEESQKQYIGDTKVNSFPCKMYELKQAKAGLTCPKDEFGNDACVVGPNNYPDFGNYRSVPITRTGVQSPF